MLLKIYYCYQGDFGNGLVCNGGLAGILSMSDLCSANSFPEVYTRVGNYTTWIRGITGGASTFQPGLAVLVMFAVVQLITAKIISWEFKLLVIFSCFTIYSNKLVIVKKNYPNIINKSDCCHRASLFASTICETSL